MSQDQQPIATMNDQSLETFESPIPTPRSDYAFDGDISTGVQPELRTWEDAKEFARTLERELVQTHEQMEANKIANELSIKRASTLIDSLQSERDKLRKDFQTLYDMQQALRPDLPFDLRLKLMAEYETFVSSALNHSKSTTQ